MLFPKRRNFSIVLNKELTLDAEYESLPRQPEPFVPISKSAQYPATVSEKNQILKLLSIQNYFSMLYMYRTSASICVSVFRGAIEIE